MDAPQGPPLFYKPFNQHCRAITKLYLVLYNMGVNKAFDSLICTSQLQADPVSQGNS